MCGILAVRPAIPGKKQPENIYLLMFGTMGCRNNNYSRFGPGFNAKTAGKAGNLHVSESKKAGHVGATETFRELVTAGTRSGGANVGGEGGIRTRGRAFRPFNCLAGSCFRPLSHLSARDVHSAEECWFPVQEIIGYGREDFK